MTPSKIQNRSLSVLPLQGLMYAAPFLIGLFHEWSAGLASLYLIGWLFTAHRKGKFLLLPKNISMLSLSVISLFYLVSSLWAVDRGMAVLGFIKFLPLPLFALAVYQFDRSERERLLETGDEASAKRCREELLSIPDRMDAVLANTSPLGWKINDRPSLQLPTEYRQYLWQLENN